MIVFVKTGISGVYMTLLHSRQWQTKEKMHDFHFSRSNFSQNQQVPKKSLFKAFSWKKPQVDKGYFTHFYSSVWFFNSLTLRG